MGRVSGCQQYVEFEEKKLLYICLYYTSDLLSQFRKEKRASRRMKPERTRQAVKQALSLGTVGVDR